MRCDTPPASKCCNPNSNKQISNSDFFVCPEKHFERQIIPRLNSSSSHILLIRTRENCVSRFFLLGRVQKSSWKLSREDERKKENSECIFLRLVDGELTGAKTRIRRNEKEDNSVFNDASDISYQVLPLSLPFFKHKNSPIPRFPMHKHAANLEKFGTRRKRKKCLGKSLSFPQRQKRHAVWGGFKNDAALKLLLKLAFGLFDVSPPLQREKETQTHLPSLLRKQVLNKFLG